MERSAIATAIGAITSALATLVCCLPVGFLGAAGLAAVAGVFQAGRPWLLGLSGLLLVLGFAQVVRAQRCRREPGWLVLALLALGLFVVLIVALFPQVIADWLAELGGTGGGEA